MAREKNEMSDAVASAKDDLIVITGAGGFIGGYLVSELWRRGHRRIRAVDIKPAEEWFQAAGRMREGRPWRSRDLQPGV